MELWHPPRKHIVVHVLSTFTIDALRELKDEVRKQSWHSKLAHDLNECLPDADAATAQKGREAVRIASLSSRCQVIFRLRVKPLRDELLWFDPLFRIVAKGAHHDRQRVALSDLEFFTLHGL